VRDTRRRLIAVTTTTARGVITISIRGEKASTVNQNVAVSSKAKTKCIGMSAKRRTEAEKEETDKKNGHDRMTYRNSSQEDVESDSCLQRTRTNTSTTK
jgi:hypothetical protein